MFFTTFSIHIRDEQSTLVLIKWRLKMAYKEQNRKIWKKNTADFHSQWPNLPNNSTRTCVTNTGNYYFLAAKGGTRPAKATVQLLVTMRIANEYRICYLLTRAITRAITVKNICKYILKSHKRLWRRNFTLSWKSSSSARTLVSSTFGLTDKHSFCPSSVF